MDLTPYVENLHRDLLVAAEAGGEDARALAERLIAPLESTIRLTLLNALSAAAEEITRELAPGSVDVRLRGLDPSFAVTLPAQDLSSGAGNGFRDVVHGDLLHGTLSSATGTWSSGPLNDEEGATARINFRPPEHLKSRIEEAAGREGLSVNAWLVRAVTAVLGSGERCGERGASKSGRHYVGWVG
jgi:hypothetical protein